MDCDFCEYAEDCFIPEEDCVYLEEESEEEE